MERLRLTALMLAAILWQWCAGAVKADILVIGAGTSGVAAALQAARMGRTVVLADELPWVGGMLTSAGVCAADGNYNLRGGLWAEFVDALSSHYGGLEALRTGWVSNILFEPQVAQSILSDMIEAEPRITRLRYRELVALDHDAPRLWRAKFKKARHHYETVEASVIIDGTELGDIVARLGIAFDTGMESAESTGEDIAPANSNGIIQDLTYVAIVESAGAPVEMEEPEGYDPAEFACAATNVHCTAPAEPGRMWNPAQMLTYGRMPGGKYMINWPIEGNDYYADIARLGENMRRHEISKSKARTLRFLYFLHKELGMDTLRLATEVFPSHDGLALMPYYREGRRARGLVRFTLPYICEPYGQPLPLYRTAIAVGDYPVDQHHGRYDGAEPLPDLHYHPIPSWGLPAGTLIPYDTDDVIVAEKAISVSNIVNGTTRLQPVVMQVGQAAGALAALAVAHETTPREVPVRDLQRALLASGAYLLPFSELAPGDRGFEAVQRLGVCGLLRGQGRAEGWTGVTTVSPDGYVTADDVALLLAYFGKEAQLSGDTPLRGKKIATAMRALGAEPPRHVAKAKRMTRLEYAVLVDSCLHPFDIPIDYNGNFSRK